MIISFLAVPTDDFSSPVKRVNAILSLLITFSIACCQNMLPFSWSKARHSSHGWDIQVPNLIFFLTHWNDFSLDIIVWITVGTHHANNDDWCDRILHIQSTEVGESVMFLRGSHEVAPFYHYTRIFQTLVVMTLVILILTRTWCFKDNFIGKYNASPVMDSRIYEL